MSSKPALTAERLRVVLNYDPATGEFVWAAKTNRKMVVGAVAGSLSRGRLVIGIDRKCYLGSRLAWLYVHGDWPTQEIDHINGDSSDDRICNLRDVGRTANQQNQRKPRVTNRSGLQGVCPARGAFEARIKVNGASMYLGKFKTAQEAHAVYLCAKRQLHEGNTL